MNRKWIKIITFSCLVIVIFMTGFYTRIIRDKSISECDISKYEYINEDIKCDSKFVIKKNGYVEFKNNLIEVINENKEKKNIADVSIYFRDLQNGPTLGINEHESFTPASLLKVPLLLAYFNLRDSISDLFNRKIYFEGANKVVSQDIVPSRSIEVGQVYTVKDLLNYMIKYSDNQAYYVLLNYLNKISPDKDLLKETYIDLGILFPKSFIDETLSVKSYSSIFIQLFNSSYFSKKENSEEVLSMLSDIDWKDGLNIGIPTNIEIAHKFGERKTSKEIKQLHDCGIVYFLENPYLLCVMTRGDDFKKLSEFIGLVSKMFYEEINSRKL